MILDHNFEPPLVLGSMRVYDQKRKEGAVTAAMLDALPNLRVAWPYYLTDLTTMPERQFVKNEITDERMFSGRADRDTWGFEIEAWFVINDKVFDHHTPTFAFNYDDKVQTLIAGPDSHPHHQ